MARRPTYAAQRAVFLRGRCARLSLRGFALRAAVAARLCAARGCRCAALRCARLKCLCSRAGNLPPQDLSLPFEPQSCAPALGTSPSPSFEGGFSDGGGGSRVHSNTGAARHPQPPWKGGFWRELRGIRVKRGTPAPPAVSENPTSYATQTARRPSLTALAMCSPTTQCRSTILPREDLLTRKLLPQRGRQGGGESPPLPRGNFAQRRRLFARCDES